MSTQPLTDSSSAAEHEDIRRYKSWCAQSQGHCLSTTVSDVTDLMWGKEFVAN